jgi:hypothetical protein
LGWAAGKLRLLVLVGLLAGSTFAIPHAYAEENEPPGPDRAAIVNVDFISYNWWLVNWEDNSVSCDVYIEHEGLPSHNEIYNACGGELYYSWVATQPCDQSNYCEGYYLHFVGSVPSTRSVGVLLPAVQIWLSLKNCDLMGYTNVCNQPPVIVLTAEEPLPNESILGIEGLLEGEPFSCDSICELPFSQETGEDGMQLDFWAYSSYGDSSVPFSARVRVVILDDTLPGERAWFVDVLSSQWTGSPTASCSQTWESFPPLEGIPAWLTTPADANLLASNIPYEYLARNLIKQGVVDVSGCPDSGLSVSGEASMCGLEAAQNAVEKWQNRFDGQIYTVAVETGIPAQLLKNLFSRESQFWPGVNNGAPEAGLGQMTENGADTTLLWNNSFYNQFCTLVLDDLVCKKPYALLSTSLQETLRSALVQSVNAFCVDCPLGINLEQANSSVRTFAETLLANCEQAGRIVQNIYKSNPGQVSTYDDLWRFTLVNYNAGSGCLILALQETVKKDEPADWSHVSANLTPVCVGALDYIRDISQ